MGAKKLNRDSFAWYRRYPSRALSGMRGLNPEQRGVYCTIIDLCYDRRSPLTDDDVAMARDCECDVRRYRRIKAELLAKGRIVVDEANGLIYDERAVRELVAAQMYSETEAERARKPHRKSTTRSSKRKTTREPAKSAADLQDLGRTVEPKSPSRPLKEQEKTEANREEKNLESLPAEARPPSPSIGGGRFGAKSTPITEDLSEREAAKAAAQKRLRDAIEADGAPA